MSKIYIAADHAGFELKETLKPVLEELEYVVEDCGAVSFDVDDDYPDMVRLCAERVAADPGTFGIIIGASGQGEAIAANRVPGIRATVYYGTASGSQTDAAGNSLDMIASMRTHNDANILSLGARFMSVDEAAIAVRTFLATSFSGEERHIRRIEKLG